jgi:hypothetical protein
MWVYNDQKLMLSDPDKFFQTYISGGHKASQLIASNRNDGAYGDYVKVALPKRFGIRRPNGDYWIDVAGHAQMSDFGDADTHGTHIDIFSISEEHYRDYGTHYSLDEFIDRIAYSIAHEIFHLIGGKDKPGQVGPLGGDFCPLRDMTITDAERQEVNLLKPISVKP